MELCLQSLEEDGHALVELCFPVVTQEHWRELAQVREVLLRQSVQSEFQSEFVLVGIDNEFLEFVEDVTDQETIVGAVRMEGACGSESGASEYSQDLLQRPQSSQWSQSHRCRKGPCHQQWNDMGVLQDQGTEVMGRVAQLVLPGRQVTGSRNDPLIQQKLGQAIQECIPVSCIPVQSHGIFAEFSTQLAHRQSVEAVRVNQIKGCPKNSLPTQPATPASGLILPSPLDLAGFPGRFNWILGLIRPVGVPWLVDGNSSVHSSAGQSSVTMLHRRVYIVAG